MQTNMRPREVLAWAAIPIVAAVSALIFYKVGISMERLLQRDLAQCIGSKVVTMGDYRLSKLASMDVYRLMSGTRSSDEILREMDRDGNQHVDPYEHHKYRIKHNLLCQ